MAFMRIILLLIVTSVLGCAAQPEHSADSAQAVSASGADAIRYLGPGLVPSNDDERAIAGRAIARWDALRSFDMKGVYQFATPAYKAAHDEIHLGLQYFGQVERLGAVVKSIKFDGEEPGLALVEIAMWFRAASGYEGTGFVTQKWLKIDGIWWHLEPK